MAAQPGTPTSTNPPTLNDARALLAGVTAGARVDPLETLADLDTIAREAVEAMDAVVIEARRRGCSWREIGLATGITSAGANDRWGAVVAASEAAARRSEPFVPRQREELGPIRGPQRHHRPPGSWDRGGLA